MWQRPENDQFADELFLAGERVAPGVYRQVGSDKVIRLETEDILPASCDGHVACYVRIQNLWSQIQAVQT
ncbi:MAG: hypothetical protein RMM08_06915 [Armatimonadota bacterium]|nr:hypothetical protein [bacterium]MDW8321075.1 hypothetical protein [Armatimonadota bacterium]